ncbi:hypothetical protein AOLI_G00031240 [Acnodon oligacanthus]
MLELLGNRGILVASGLAGVDLLLLAASTVGCPHFPFDGIVPVVFASPARPANAGQRHTAKSSSPLQATGICGSPAPLQHSSPRSPPPVTLARSDPDLHLVRGRSFVSVLLLLAHVLVELRVVVALGDGCWPGVRFWSRLLELWNGFSSFYSDVVGASGSLALFLDAAPSVGFGGYFQGQWFAEKWPLIL